MKQTVLFCLCCFVFLTNAPFLKSQPLFYDEGRNINIDAGYKRANLNCGTFDVAYVEATTYLDPVLGWEFSTKFELGKDYISFSPLSIVGLAGWIYASTHGSGKDVSLIMALLSISSAKLPIYVWDWFEVTPYWNLLKFTKIYDEGKFKLNADVGLQLKFYPFCSSYSISTLYLSPFCQYDFAYKKNASDFRYTSYGPNIKQMDKSLFHGWACGMSIGYYF